MWVEWHCWLLVTQINFPPFWPGRGEGQPTRQRRTFPDSRADPICHQGESTSRLLRRCICLKIVVMLLCKASCQERRAPTFSLPPTHDIASHRFHLISPFVRGAIITTAIINRSAERFPGSCALLQRNMHFEPKKSWEF